MLFGSQKITQDGHFQIGGCDSVELARHFGTPLYVLDEALLRQRMRQYREAFQSRYPKNSINYAGKAFLTTAMCKIVEQEGLNLDVASGGELYTAIQAGFPAERIEMHGNNKSAQEIDLALDYGIGRVIIDNLLEVEMLAEAAAHRNMVQPVLIRTTPGVDPKTHRLISVGQEDTKFGLSMKDGSAMEAVWKATAHPNLSFRGIHCHVGSQLMDGESQAQAADVMCQFMREIQDVTGQAVPELNMGGGLGIKYLESQNPCTIDEYAEMVVNAVNQALEKYNLEPPLLAHEPGRSIAGQAGVTLYTIGAIKKMPIPQDPGERIYVNIDGGMSDNPRPQLYDAVYEAFVANRADQPKTMRVRVSGKHCETDILIQDTCIQPAETGDILVVPGTGAYNYAMASNYNRLTRPAVVLVSDGNADIIVKRETLEDLVRQDVIPERLSQGSASAV